MSQNEFIDLIFSSIFLLQSAKYRGLLDNIDNTLKITPQEKLELNQSSVAATQCVLLVVCFVASSR